MQKDPADYCYVSLVLEPILRPIAARPGDILIGWPEHSTHALIVERNGKTVRHRPCDFAVLTGELGRLANEQAITDPHFVSLESGSALKRA